MEERGVYVDHSCINRWAIRFLRWLKNAFRQHKRPVGGSWRMDETYIKVKGTWKYVYRAVDTEGQTVDFLLTARRDKAAMDEINAQGKSQIVIRQVKYLNNLVEQDHRAIKRVTRPMLNFKSFRTARSILAGIELMHMIRKGQLILKDCIELSFADQFYALAGKIRPV